MHQIITAVKIAVRSFQKHWIYGTLNVLGLSLAFGSVLLIATYIYQETTYENFYQNADRIYRATYKIQTASGFEAHWARIPVDYINELPQEFGEIETLIRFQNQEKKYIRVGNERYVAENAFITDSAVFEVFHLSFIYGNPDQALAQPYSAVITRSMAIRYFGELNVIGRNIEVVGDYSTEEITYQITGVLEDLPVNTHLPIEVLFSFSSREERTGWAYVYVLLEESVDISQVEGKLSNFIDKYSGDESVTETSFVFQKLRDIHLDSNLAREIKPNSTRLYVKIFLWAGLFIWLVALVNFSNLNAALAIERRKELGIRQILGASRRTLVGHTMFESAFYTLVALFLGWTLAMIGFPFFSQLTGIEMIPPAGPLLLISLGFVLITVLISGALASWHTSFSNVIGFILRGSGDNGQFGSFRLPLKRTLIGLQFCATIILVMVAVNANLQLRFLSDKELGIEPTQVLAISDVPNMVTDHYQIFRERVASLSGVLNVAACMQVPSSAIRDVGPVQLRGSDDASTAPMMDMQIIDRNFIPLLDLEILDGRNLSESQELLAAPVFSDTLTPESYLGQRSREYLINETAMRELGWNDPSEALGKEINWSIGPYEMSYGPIVGVVRDYHQESLKNNVDPVLMMFEPIWLRSFLIEVETSDIQTTIRSIEEIWRELFPFALRYGFLDEMFESLYTHDKVQTQLLSLFTMLSVILSLIGLVSLLAFSLRSRAKELAIRRVIGSNLSSMARLVGQEYFWLILVASVIGVPVSYWGITRWLENFAYQIQVQPVTYLLCIFGMLAMVSAVVIGQTFRATRENPMKALREN